MQIDYYFYSRIISVLKKLGWEQIFENNDESYKLKWVQCGRSINWNSFREGTKK
jgi:hypothetical protein